MKRFRKILIFSAVLLLALLFLWCNIKDIKQQPNFIVILTDDQPIGYMGFEGNSIVNTPNLDKMAKEGICFSNAYITSAICTPSRTSFLTGQYERKHGVNFNSGTSLNLEAWNQTYPMLLRKAGYYTGYIGKNHTPVGDGGYESGVMEKSFDYWYAGHRHLTFYPKKIHKIFKDARLDTQPEVIQEGVLDFLSTEQRLEGALKFIEQRPKGKPFCLSVNFNLPHDAGTSTMEMRPSDDEIYKSLYRDIEIPLPENYISKADIVIPKIPEKVHHYKNRQTSYNYVDSPADVKERIIRQYQAMTGIDRVVGMIREALKEQKADKNTIIIFTSDHGLFMGQFGLGGKALCYQICTHIPMIIYNPFSTSDARGKVVNELVQSIDVAPTLLSLAGVEVPKGMQGQDINPLLNGEETPVREYVFTENLWSTQFGNPRIESVQDKEWKYIRYYRNDNPQNLAKRQKVNSDSLKLVYRHYVESSLNGEPTVYEELYNLKNDPGETTNVINDLSNQQILQQMKEAWWKLLNEAAGSDVKSER